MQVIIISFTYPEAKNEVITFYSIFATSLFCIFILMNEVKNILLRIIMILVSVLSLFILYTRVLDIKGSIIVLFLIVLTTIPYTLIRLKYEANHRI